MKFESAVLTGQGCMTVLAVLSVPAMLNDIRRINVDYQESERWRTESCLAAKRLDNESFIINFPRNKLQSDALSNYANEKTTFEKINPTLQVLTILDANSHSTVQGAIKGLHGKHISRDQLIFMVADRMK